MRPQAASVCGYSDLQLLVYELLRPSATSVRGRKLLKLLVYAALSYECSLRPRTLVAEGLSKLLLRPSATSVRGRKLLVYEALGY
jgi:hypothetical protein